MMNTFGSGKATPHSGPHYLALFFRRVTGCPGANNLFCDTTVDVAPENPRCVMCPTRARPLWGFANSLPAGKVLPTRLNLRR